MTGEGQSWSDCDREAVGEADLNLATGDGRAGRRIEMRWMGGDLEAVEADARRQLGGVSQRAIARGMGGEAEHADLRNHE